MVDQDYKQDDQDLAIPNDHVEDIVPQPPIPPNAQIFSQA